MYKSLLGMTLFGAIALLPMVSATTDPEAAKAVYEDVLGVTLPIGDNQVTACVCAQHNNTDASLDVKEPPGGYSPASGANPMRQYAKYARLM